MWKSATNVIWNMNEGYQGCDDCLVAAINQGFKQGECLRMLQENPDTVVIQYQL
jgi:hypothetical protein